MSYSLDYYTEVYEKIKNKQYYIVSYVDEQISEVSILNNFSAAGLFIKAVDLFRSVDITPDIKKLKNKHSKQLAKAKLFMYYDSLMKKKSKAYANRGISKAYEKEVINFITCIKKSENILKLLPEILYIIMKFIKFA